MPGYGICLIPGMLPGMSQCCGVTGDVEAQTSYRIRRLVVHFLEGMMMQGVRHCIGRQGRNSNVHSSLLSKLA